MSLRIQIFCIIASLALFIVVVGVGTGTLLTRNGIIRLEESSLRIVADLADTLVSDRIDFLKIGAGTIADSLVHAADEDFDTVLRERTNTNIGFHSSLHFTALTVVEKIVENGREKFVIVASHGNFPVPEYLLAQNPTDILAAFEGLPTISTTVKTHSNDLTLIPELVIFVCVPIGEIHEGRVQRILCATLDGMYFSNVLSSFRIWDENSDIVLCDYNGYIVACNSQDIVLDRTNYILLAKSHPEFRSLADFFSQMIQGGSGRNQHTLRGQSRVGYYRPITGAPPGYALSVTASTYSSPRQEALRGTIMIALICLMLSLVIAFIAAGYLEKPFKEVIHARNIAEKASASKSHFLANMSHEMRTPLNAIIGFSELAISSDDAKGEVAVNLEKIYHSGLILLSTINDLLDISKIEAGKFELIPVDYDVPSLINDTAALNYVNIGSKPIQFAMDVDETLPCRLYGDELRIKQVFNNLLSNSFKYTRQGKVTWTISGEREGDNFCLISRVSDTGIGIRAEDLTTLFDEYRQVDSKTNRKIEGTGLGLTIVKKLVNLMGGTITVDSEYGKGSTFVIRIFQKVRTHDVIGSGVAFNLAHMRYSQEKLTRNAKLIRLKLPYARVLVVDDVQTNLDVTRGMLKPYGIQVDCVISGRQAIEAMQNKETRYNAIFMDHMMPEMDGIEATRRIRDLGTEYAQNIPIIALTANAIAGNEEMFLQNGFQAFLSKPIDIMRLDVEIRRWLRDKSQEAAPQSPIPDMGDSDSQDSWEIEGVDKAKALTLFGDNEETYLFILQSYVEHTPGLLDKIRTCTESQLKNYAIVVHGIKGTSYGICANTVGKLAEALEHAAKRGDFQYVSQHNAEFIKATEDLIDRTSTVLRDLNVESKSLYLTLP